MFTSEMLLYLPVMFESLNNYIGLFAQTRQNLYKYVLADENDVEITITF